MKHRHHIIPRHAGGSNDPSNIVELTIEEHALAHKQLYEEHGRWQDKVAYEMLSGQIPVAEATKKAQRLANLGNQHFKGKTHTKEYRERLSQMMKERRTDTMGHFTPHTEKTKKKISKKLMGHKKTNYGGYKLSAETRERMRQSALNRKHKY